MPGNNNLYRTGTVKPIMVEGLPLKHLEQCYDSARGCGSMEAAETFPDLLDSFEAVCKRLRLEVKRRKKAKKELASVWQQLEAERELVRNIHAERVALEAERDQLKEELSNQTALTEKYLGDSLSAEIEISAMQKVIDDLKEELDQEACEDDVIVDRALAERTV